MESSSIGISSISSTGNGYVKKTKAGTETLIKVTLTDLELNSENWQAFQGLRLLSAEAKKKFLEDMLNTTIDEILHRNPDLFMAYSVWRP